MSQRTYVLLKQETKGFFLLHLLLLWTANYPGKV